MCERITAILDKRSHKLPLVHMQHLSITRNGRGSSVTNLISMEDFSSCRSVWWYIYPHWNPTRLPAAYKLTLLYAFFRKKLELNSASWTPEGISTASVFFHPQKTTIEQSTTPNRRQTTRLEGLRMMYNQVSISTLELVTTHSCKL